MVLKGVRYLRDFFSEGSEIGIAPPDLEVRMIIQATHKLLGTGK